MGLKDIDKNVRYNISVFTISGIFVVGFYLICNNLPVVWRVFNAIFQALMPFNIGVILTLLLVPFRKIVERQLDKRDMKPRTKRMISTACSMVFLVAVIVGFFAILIPQLISSIEAFVENSESYFDSLLDLINRLHVSNPEILSNVQNFLSGFVTKLREWLTGAEGGLTQIISFSVSIVKNIMNFLMGVMITFYLLLDQEKFARQLKKLNFAILPEQNGEDIMYLCRLSGKMFNNFITGKALDSLIIGIVTWISMILLKIPYAPLIAFIIGITNMIPVFGPFIGAIPCLIILVLIKPIHALVFLVFIIILQQVDGNIIGPRILGDTMGLPTLWVMFAIIVGGALFGVLGMFLGVPIFAVIYSVTSDFINRKIREKRINIDEK